MNLEQTYARSPDVVFRHIAGEGLLIPVRGDTANLQRLFAFDDVAEFVWERLDGEQALTALAEDIVQNFDVDRERAVNDLLAFVKDLAAHELVREVTPEMSA